MLRLPGAFDLDDIAPDGRVLLARTTELRCIRAAGAAGVERDASWFDRDNLIDLSANARLITFRADVR